MLKITNTNKVWCSDFMVEYLPNKHEALSSNNSPTGKRRKLEEG
jgi:hypothetical protein